MSRLLIVEDDGSVRETLTTFLELEQYDVEAVGSTAEAMERLRARPYPIVISDIYIDDRTGLDVLEAARRTNPDCAVILMTGRGTMETVMKATQGGAFEYIAKPFELDTLLSAVKRAESAASTHDAPTDVEDLPETQMIGVSPKIVEIYKVISRVAPTNVSVLIEGETGTGKELVARLIHSNSDRAALAFVPVDCAAIAGSIMESELFGTMRGAYTGADRDRPGLFEAAHKGTAFLDEIGEMELSFQQKLLRFLQEGEIRPLGAAKPKSVDVRIIAATNRDLRKMVDDNKFREDLWYRLNVVRIHLPPLRERFGDIPLLAHFFLRRANANFRTEAVISETGLRALQEYTWPGNVRQLENTIERMAILTPQGRIDERVVRETLFAGSANEPVGETLADTEMDQIRRVLSAAGGNKSRAAKILGIERKTLYRKLERMGVE